MIYVIKMKNGTAYESQIWRATKFDWQYYRGWRCTPIIHKGLKGYEFERGEECHNVGII